MIKRITRRDFIKAAALTGVGLALGEASLILTGCKPKVPKPILRVGHLPLVDHLGLLVAADRYGEGYQNLTLETVKYIELKDLLEDLKNGEIQGAFVFNICTYKFKEVGIPAKVVLIAHRNGSTIFVAKESEIMSVSDLKGKVLAVPSRYSLYNLLSHKMVTDAGLEYEVDVKVVVMPPADMVASLQRGEIDCFIAADPGSSLAEMQGLGRVLIYSKDIWPWHIDCIVTLRDEFIAQYPDATLEFVESIVGAAEFITDNPVTAAEIGAPHLGVEDEVVLHALTRPPGRIIFHDLFPRAEEFQEQLDYAIKMGLLDKSVTIEGLIDPTFAAEVI